MLYEFLDNHVSYCVRINLFRDPIYYPCFTTTKPNQKDYNIIMGFGVIAFALILLIYYSSREKRDRKNAIRDAENEARYVQEQFKKQFPEYTVKVRFPNPATSSIEDIVEYVNNECLIAALEKYLEVSEELNAPLRVQSLIKARLRHVREVAGS